MSGRQSANGWPTAEVISLTARRGRPVPVFNLAISRIRAYAVGTCHASVSDGFRISQARLRPGNSPAYRIHAGASAGDAA